MQLYTTNYDILKGEELSEVQISFKQSIICVRVWQATDIKPHFSAT